MMRREHDQRSFHGQALSWHHEGPTLEVRLHRDPCNEIGTTMLGELEELADYVRDGCGGARALLWHSDRPGFSAGADLRELHAALIERDARRAATIRRLTSHLPDRAAALTGRGIRRVATPLVVRRVRRFLDRIHAAFDTLDMAPITTVAAVHGPVFGGGFELALTADVIVAEKSARFAFPELRLGLVPGFGGVPRLTRDVGNAVTRELLLTGRSVRASRAFELGIVAQVVARGEGLRVARAVAAQAAKFEPEVVAAAKQLAKPLPREHLDREKETFCRLVASPVVLEALTRFVEREDALPYLP